MLRLATPPSLFVIRVARVLLLGRFLCVPSIAIAAPSDDTPSADAAEFFERRVRPLLAENCFSCHGPTRQRSELRLDSRSDLLKGGTRGPAVVLGNARDSLLMLAVGYSDADLRMPPKSRLKDEQIGDLARWIDSGAPWPASSVDRTSGDAPNGPNDDWTARQQHWAFQPIRAAAPPPASVGNDATAIDRFILAKLQAAGLSPAPPADRRTLIRRATFDLIGLPPTPDEVAAFVADESPDAYARLLDRLLASPHFGERWARHWLDLVRYAETRGHEFDHIIPNAYQYRDYVIRALNADVPYDTFLTEHIAGDLVPEPRLHPTRAFNESILGTGFWFLGEEVHSPVDIRGDETDRLDNKIDVMTKTFLGLTVSCARCHDHKFDPITSRDYYALAGFLLSSSYRQVQFDSLERNRRIARELESLRAEQRGGMLKAVAAAHRQVLGQLGDYLLAACEVNRSAANGSHSGNGAHVQAASARRGLDTALVAKWAEYLCAVRDDRADPFHVWSVLAFDAQADVAFVTRDLLESPAIERSPRDVLRNTRVLLDFSRTAVEDWRTDGLAFGLGPVRVGDAQFGTDPTRPIRAISRFAAARLDPTWAVLRTAPGTERDPGKLASLDEGRILRTPTITLTSGKLHYLVQGSGVAYAAVDSHRLIAGPLHGTLVKSWSADGSSQSPRWIEHDLSTYAGHRVHVEFSPLVQTEGSADASSEFAILQVIESDRPPPAPVAQQSAWQGIFRATDLRSLDSLAQAFERSFVAANELLANDGVADAANAEHVAWLANWLVQRPELLTADMVGASRDLARAALPFVERQAALVAAIQPVSRAAPALLDGSGVDEHVLLRGNPKTPGELVPRRFLELFDGAADPIASRGSGRFELARRMIDPANPLVARVMVNRVWYHLFGRGIVPSVDNFGRLGEPPTHPELLDYLATQFIANGWSIKQLVREIMLSRTYQMSSRADERAAQLDPDNTMLHHARVRRLEGEAIRDAILALSGRLDRAMYGPSVEVHLTPFMEGRGRPAQSGPLDGAGRRSIYLKVRRNFLNPMLAAFDAPPPFSTMGRRSVSNVPAQALVLLNNPFVVEQAQLWAARALATAEELPQERVMSLYESAFARPPSPTELNDALQFLAERRAELSSGPNDPRLWADLCHVFLNVKEFILIH